MTGLPRPSVAEATSGRIVPADSSIDERVSHCYREMDAGQISVEEGTKRIAELSRERQGAYYRLMQFLQTP